MKMDKKKVRQILIRSLLIAVAAALSVLYCLSLNGENKRYSDPVNASGRSINVGDGDEIIQQLTFDPKEERLYGVALLFSVDAVNPCGNVIVEMNRDGDKIAEWKREGQYIQYTEYEFFYLDRAEDIKDHRFELKISFEGFGDAKPFSFPTGVSEKTVPAVINGGSTEGSLCYRSILDIMPGWQMIVIPAMIFVIFLLWQGVYFILIKPRFKTGETADFASVYIALLLLYYVFVPLNTVFDEGNHFLRSYSVAHGKMIADVLPANLTGGDVLPEDVGNYARLYGLNAYHDGKRQNDEALKELNADRSKVRETAFPNTAINVPYMYFPQAAGIRIAELFTPKIYYLAYCGRLFNMIITALLVLFAVRFTPSGKGYFKFTALLPMMMQETVSLAPDGFITALIMVYIALILKARFDSGERLGMKYRIALYVLTILVVLCKIVYAPVCLLLFLIPPSKFGKRSGYLASVGVFGISILSFVLSWLLIVQRYNLRFQDSNSEMQLQFMISEPHKLLNVFGRYFMDSGEYAMELYGRTMGNSNIPLPSFVPVLFILVAAIYAYRHIRFPRGEAYAGRLLPAVIVILVFLLVGLAEYTGWTKVGASRIGGVSGRYFLQLVPFSLFALSGIKKDGTVSERFREITTFACVLMNLTAIVSYWIFTVY